MAVYCFRQFIAVDFLPKFIVFSVFNWRYKGYLCVLRIKKLLGIIYYFEAVF